MTKPCHLYSIGRRSISFVRRCMTCTGAARQKEKITRKKSPVRATGRSNERVTPGAEGSTRLCQVRTAAAKLRIGCKSPREKFRKPRSFLFCDMVVVVVDSAPASPVLLVAADVSLYFPCPVTERLGGVSARSSPVSKGEPRRPPSVAQYSNGP